jgi:GNAT superfamily N-acetyltransferase
VTQSEAEQVAALLNRRNELSENYTAEAVLRHSGLYEYEVIDGRIAACVERKKVQWYQWEIRHLSVTEDLERKGVAYAVYSRAESAARAGGACILQCTIRHGNGESERFFRRQGFERTRDFRNQRTGNNVGVWQKVLQPIESRSEADGAVM